jgi:hypothetical protein
MRIPLIALCALGGAVSDASSVATRDVPTLKAKHNDAQKIIKIARTVTTDALRGSRGAAAFALGGGRILKEDNKQARNGGDDDDAQVEECDKDCKKAMKEAEKNEKKKAEKEAAKDGAKAVEKVPTDINEGVANNDKQGTTDKDTPAEAENEEPEVAGTEEPFVVVVPPTSVKEDPEDDNKAVLPSPAQDGTIFVTNEEEDTSITDTYIILENAGSGISSQNNNPTATGLTSSNTRSKSAKDDSIQPVGKALLFVALAGVLAAFIAVFLLRSQRRQSSDPTNALAITPYAPSKDGSYFADWNESYDVTCDVDLEKQIVWVDTAASSPIQTPEKASSTSPHREDAHNDPDVADDSFQSSPLTCIFPANFCSTLPYQLDISPCTKPTMLEASVDDSAVQVPPDVHVVAAPSVEMEGEENEENLTRNNTAGALMRKYQMDDVSVNIVSCHLLDSFLAYIYFAHLLIISFAIGRILNT